MFVQNADIKMLQKSLQRCPCYRYNLLREKFDFITSVTANLNTTQAINSRQRDYKKSYTDGKFTELLNSGQVSQLLNLFTKDKEIKSRINVKGISDSLLEKSLKTFKKKLKYESSGNLKAKKIIYGVLQGQLNPGDILPIFMKHSLSQFPAIKQHEDIARISNLSDPVQWYPDTRLITRKITFHAGPTNSGKTYAALQRFNQSESGVYCGPLRLLAREVCDRIRAEGIECDMLTGEERDYQNEGQYAQKTSCTVEMANTSRRYDVAIIDEIQMLEDMQRGWAWTRALLGVVAEEIRICGEARAIPIVKKLAKLCGDELTIERYRRLGKLSVKKNPVESLSNLKNGDCLVCFRKSEIYKNRSALQKLGKKTAIIYGNLPMQTKIEQTRRFNNPKDPCSILISTDAIGMGLNLNIKRIVFNDIKKTTLLQNGNRRERPIAPHHALQIAGRSGRFGTRYEDGAVTALKKEHMPVLHKLLLARPYTIKSIGLQPTFDKIQEVGQAMKSQNLYDILTVFISLCEMHSNLYFLCALHESQDIAFALQHLPLPLEEMYRFSMSPIPTDNKLALETLVFFADAHYQGKAVSSQDLKEKLKWPPKAAYCESDMVRLEDLNICLRLYLWLSFRFEETFSSRLEVQRMQEELDTVTSKSVVKMNSPLQHAEKTKTKNCTESEEILREN